MAEAVDDSMDIEKLYEYGERLNDATDKSQHKTDYENIIAAANGSVKAKQLAAQLIPKFFKYFPQLSHQALDQHLYLCEDEELAVRVQAIQGLPLFCKDTPEYLSKIVDILAQLLVTSENIERDAVHKALMSLLRQDVKTSLTALFKHIGSTAEQNAEELTAWESIREKVLCFIKDKVFPLKTELLRPQEEMEWHITNLVKQNLQELVEIIEGQADLDAQFDKVFEKAKTSRPSTLAVYLYIPNIIGYVRVLMNVVGFAVCFQDKKIFSILYLISFLCDALDGWFARKFNQVSTFGAVLDMLTDRISTACLLVILSQVYRPGLIFLSLLALDIASHWLQMYSTFLVGKTSHKDVKNSSNWLFRAYYGSRKFMGYCCASCEVLYIMLFLLAENQNENLAAVLTSAARQPGINILLVVVLFGCIVKQLVNVIQMKTAADLCVLFDINKKQ